MAPATPTFDTHYTSFKKFVADCSSPALCCPGLLERAEFLVECAPTEVVKHEIRALRAALTRLTQSRQTITQAELMRVIHRYTDAIDAALN